jgi:hypothetical protein
MYGGGSMMGGGMGMQNPYLQNIGIDPSSPYDLIFTKRSKDSKSASCHEHEDDGYQWRQ